MHIQRLALAGVVVACIVLAAEPPVKIKGVAPQDLRALKFTLEEFTCRDGSKTIPFAHVNDDFCDCADGSDEPATPACPKGHMYCANRGHVWKIIPSSQVWDGVCDCCDGSDEQGGRAREGSPCENTCKAMAAEARKDQIQELETQREGLKVKEQYIQKAKQEFEAKRAELDTLKRRQGALQADKGAAEEAKKQAEEAESAARAQLEERRKAEEEAKRAANPDAPAAEEAKIDESQDKVAPPAHIDDEHTEATDESIRDEEQPSASDDADDFDIVDEDETAHKESSGDTAAKAADDEELRPLVDDTPGWMPPPLALAWNYVRALFGQNVTHLLPGGGSASPASAAKTARDAFDKINNELSDVERNIKSIEDLFSTDFGPENEFYALKGQCFSVGANEYTYELCPFGQSNQKPRSGATTLLGNWEQNDEWRSTHRTMMYTGGLRCWSGPDRSTKVTVLCGRDNRVADPEEPSRCEYSLKLYTPAACSKEHALALQLELETEESDH